MGAYVGHGETILEPNTPDDSQVLWWSKGTVLRGTSPQHVRWFREVLNNRSARPAFEDLQPSELAFGFAMVSTGADYMRLYFNRTGVWTIALPSPQAKFDAYAIDYWGMTVRALAHSVQGTLAVTVSELPSTVELRGVQVATP